MARTKTEKAARFNDVEFIRCELTDAHKQDLKSRVKAGYDGWDNLQSLIEDGYRVTVKYDTWSSSPACFIQQMAEDGDNQGCILSGRGRTVHGAILEALYKHFVVFDGVWPTASFKGQPIMWDD